MTNQLHKDHLQFVEQFCIYLLPPAGILEHKIQYHKRDCPSDNFSGKLHAGHETTSSGFHKYYWYNETKLF